MYAEGLVADLVEQLEPGSVGALALRMQQLKMLLRCTINAILDVRVHTRGMTEAEAMALMTTPRPPGGRRGRRQVAPRAARPAPSSRRTTSATSRCPRSPPTCGPPGRSPALLVVHDAMLAHGSPSPRLLRSLLELG